MYLFIAILFYFQALGMCPLPLNFNKNDKTIKIFQNIFVFWSFFNVILVTLLALISFLLNDELFQKHNTIGRFNDILKFSTIILTHLTVLIESLCTRDHQKSIWQKFQSIDQSFSKIDVDSKAKNNIFYRFFSIKFILWFGIATIIEILIVTFIREDDQYKRYWYLTIISLTVSRSRHLQQNLYIDMLAFRFNNIKKELKEIVKQSEKDQYSQKEEMFSKKLLTKVKYIKEMYNVLWEISVHINKGFGLSQLANLMQNFIQLTSDLYWIYSALYKNNFTNIGVLILGLIPTFSILTILLFSCEKCLREVRLIGFLIHNIEKDIDNYEFDTLVNRQNQ